MMEFVSWEGFFPTEWRNKINVPNHHFVALWRSCCLSRRRQPCCFCISKPVVSTAQFQGDPTPSDDCSKPPTRNGWWILWYPRDLGNHHFIKRQILDTPRLDHFLVYICIPFGQTWLVGFVVCQMELSNGNMIYKWELFQVPRLITGGYW